MKGWMNSMARRGSNRSSDVIMNSWDDWFENCGALISDLQNYEDKLWDYYTLQYPVYDDADKNREYAGKHDIAFYENEPKFPSWKIKTLIVRGLLGLVVGTVVMFLFYMVTAAITHTDVVWQDKLISSGIIGLIVGLVVAGFTFLRAIMKVRKVTGILANLEKKMERRIKYVPPKYRNSIAIGELYNLYRNYRGVLTFNQALQEIDSWLAQLPLNDGQSIGRTIAVMFDVKYEHTGLEGDADDEAEAAARGLYVPDSSSPALSDPNLPEDIRVRTFAGTPDADKKLAELIGLDNVKDQIGKMKNRMKFYGDNRTERISGNHMCFLGPPGTGKTTIARIITSILYDFGYIKENKCVEIDGGYMKSPYVGQTTQRAQAIINYSKGGVLFIDEAYLMLDSAGNQGSAGTEATGVLLKAMEDNKNDFVVIFAGYEDNVNRLLASNEGFNSRIKYKIYFDDFSLKELMQIFDLNMRLYSKNGTYTIEKDARAELEKSFDKERSAPGFGNARVVRNALDMILDVHADHYMKRLIPEDKKFVFTKKDIDEYIKLRNKQLAEDARNYIANKGIDNSIVSFSELKGRTKEGSANPDKDLAELTGLEVVKNEIDQMKAQFEFYGGKMGENEGYHMCFMGPPGTGKSTVAGIMTAYLYEMGIIRQNCYLDINGDFLRGMYLGHTGKRTEAVIQYCQGMVLFVDEAYLLQQDDTGDNFGQEAIGVLLDAMEKHRKNFVVIFAGYDKEMNAFLNANSGLRSRIVKTFHFSSYSANELAKMMQGLAKKDKFKIEKEVWIPLQRYLKTRLDEPHFGNARFIRSFWGEVKNEHIMNYAAKKYEKDHKYVITLADVEPLFSKNIQAEPKEEFVEKEVFDDY